MSAAQNDKGRFAYLTMRIERSMALQSLVSAPMEI
jgi:hypothetical protein